MIRGRGGQSLVELMLILPVFMLMLFLVLELGNIAYHTIVAHHVAYEMARVGALVGVKTPGGVTNQSIIERNLQEQASLMFADRRRDMISFTTELEFTSNDKQLEDEGVIHRNEDLIVEVTYPVRLVFPGTNWIFADPPKKLGIKKLKAKVRMPVERPLLN